MANKDYPIVYNTLKELEKNKKIDRKFNFIISSKDTCFCNNP